MPKKLPHPRADLPQPVVKEISMPNLDLVATKEILTALQAEIAERINGIGNTTCADDDKDDKAALEKFNKEYEEWRLAAEAYQTANDKFQSLGYPTLPTLKVSLKTKERIQKELAASQKADSIIIGTRSAVSGVLSFGPTVPKS